MDENIGQDIGNDDIRLDFYTSEKISRRHMDVLHTRVKLNIFLRHAHRHLIQIIGVDVLSA